MTGSNGCPLPEGRSGTKRVHWRSVFAYIPVDTPWRFPSLPETSQLPQSENSPGHHGQRMPPHIIKIECRSFVCVEAPYWCRLRSTNRSFCTNCRLKSFQRPSSCHFVQRFALSCANHRLFYHVKGLTHRGVMSSSMKLRRMSVKPRTSSG